MNLFLAKNAPIVLTGLAQQKCRLDNIIPVSKFQVSICISQIVPCAGFKDSETLALCKKLRERLVPTFGSEGEDSLIKRFACDLSGWEDDEEEENISYGEQLPVDWLRCEFVPVSDSEVNCAHLLVKSGSVTNALLDLFGEGVRMQIEFSNAAVFGYGFVPSARSSEMKLNAEETYACEDPLLSMGSQPYKWCPQTGGWGLFGSVTIKIIKCATPESFQPVTTQDNLRFIRKMLQEEVETDLVIIPGEGNPVKAHKALLCVHSSVFSAMFQGDMKEAKTGTVEIPDVSEEGVRAILAYLYYWEETQPNANPLVAFDMFQLGHKYDIPVLEASIRKLLLQKPVEWYDVDVAMKLFLFAKKLPEDGDCLKKKAAKVLKKNSGKLKQSSVFTSLFKENPEAAMELCQYAFNV